jgi:hypothetical protein
MRPGARDSAQSVLSGLTKSKATCGIVFATLSVSPNGADVPFTAVVEVAKEIRPYVQGFAMNNIRPSDSRMINFLLALSTP